MTASKNNSSRTIAHGIGRRVVLQIVSILGLAVLMLGLLGAGAAVAAGVSNTSNPEIADGTFQGMSMMTAPSGSLTATYFVCPTVSTNNPDGAWVVGYHGAYYVLVPGPGQKVFINIPVHVALTAGIPAGWAIYGSLPNYPNFVGTAMVLWEGLERWLGSPAGWQEGDMINVADTGKGTYTVTDLRLSQSIVITSPIPLGSAEVW